MLLEVRIEPSRGKPSGWRVQDDGRVEKLGNGWRASFRLDEAGLARVRAAARATLTEVDRDHYGEGAAVEGGATATWRLEQREIVVDGFPLVHVTPLDDLLQTLLDERGPGWSISTRWTWPGGSRDFDGEPAAVPELVPLLDLALPDCACVPAARPAGPPLLEIEWRVDGKAGDRLAVYPDGRRILVEDGRAQEADPLDAAAVESLRERLRSL